MHLEGNRRLPANICEGGPPSPSRSYNYRCSKSGQNINFATLTGLLGSTRSTADVPAAVLKTTSLP
jgi:hypothetical protein